MRYYVLLALVSLATFAVSNTVSALALRLAWPRIRAAAARREAAARARLLAWTRLAPTAIAGVAMALIAVVFIRFEPADTSESPGVLLLSAAFLPVLLAGAAIPACVSAALSGRRCLRLIESCGERVRDWCGVPVWHVDTPYPLAAVMGTFRPRLLLSRQLVAACSPAELASVMRHELAHVTRRDNLTRILLAYLPDAICMGDADRELRHDWTAAAEEAADDAGAGGTVAGRLQMAAALVRVAGMATAPRPSWVPPLAFYQGNSLDSRVRRLLSSRAAGSRAALLLPLAIVPLVAAASVAANDLAAARLHGWLETAMLLLP